MRVPYLFSLARPTAPKWSRVEPDSAKEMEWFARAMVVVVVRMPNTGRYEPIGTGTIIGCSDQIAVLTAAHIFVDIVNQFRPPRWSGLPGTKPDKEDFHRRLQEVLRDGVLRVIVDPRSDLKAEFCEIQDICLSMEYRRNDTALVLLKTPDSVDRRDVVSVPLDLQCIPSGDLVLMAGYSGGVIEAEGTSISVFGRDFEIRVGYVGELAPQAEGFLGIPMLRVNMPSMPGMSGGPLLTVWHSHNPEILPTGSTHYALAGIVSRSRIGTPILLDHNEDGETWVTPLDTALDYLWVHLSPEHGLVNLRTAVEKGFIPSVQLDPARKKLFRHRK